MAAVVCRLGALSARAQPFDPSEHGNTFFCPVPPHAASLFGSMSALLKTQGAIISVFTLFMLSGSLRSWNLKRYEKILVTWGYLSCNPCSAASPWGESNLIPAVVIVWSLLTQGWPPFFFGLWATFKITESKCWPGSGGWGWGDTPTCVSKWSDILCSQQKSQIRSP